MKINEIEIKFKTEVEAVQYFEKVRWGNEIKCPSCSSNSIGKLDKQFNRSCRRCSKIFSVTANTQLHHTRLPLKTWLYAFSIISEGGGAISASELHRQLLPLTYKTVHKMHIKACQLMAMEILGSNKYEAKGDKESTVSKTLKIDFLEVEQLIIEYRWEHKQHLKRKQVGSTSKIDGLLTYLISNYRSYTLSNEIGATDIERFWNTIRSGMEEEYHHITVTHFYQYLAEHLCKSYDCGVYNLFELLVNNSMQILNR